MIYFYETKISWIILKIQNLLSSFPFTHDVIAFSSPFELPDPAVNAQALLLQAIIIYKVLYELMSFYRLKRLNVTSEFNEILTFFCYQHALSMLLFRFL